MLSVSNKSNLCSQFRNNVYLLKPLKQEISIEYIVITKQENICLYL